MKTTKELLMSEMRRNDLQDWEIGFVIPCDRGINMEFTNEGSKCKTHYDKGFPREVKLDLTSWVGISGGAIHTYGKLKVDSLNFQILKANPKDKSRRNGMITNSYGYDPEPLPLETRSFEIELTRKITEADLRLDCGRTFKGDKVDDDTCRFNTREEVVKRAKKVFKKVFGNGWKLTIETESKRKDKMGYYYANYQKTIAVNK